jgi:4'-phosphopantetheinyl transferase EntD
VNAAVVVTEFASPRASTLLSGVFPRGTVTIELRGAADPALAHPDEIRACAPFAAKRTQDYLAGRACARHALHAFDIEDFALGSNADRSASWPAGFAGSITHTAGFSAAVVAPQAIATGIGIDAEIVSSVAFDLWPSILTPAEYAVAASWPAERRQRYAAVVFSAKESFYKCQAPLTGKWLDFLDVVVNVRFDTHTDTSGRFSIAPPAACGRTFAARPLTGRFRIEDDLVVTGITYRRLAAVS